MMDLDAIRRAHSLPEVAARFIKLRRAGSEWLGQCPFHDDGSPSFTIWQGGTRFHCFGCGATGDVLDFAQRAWGVGLIEAARMLGADEARCIQPGSKPETCGTIKRRETEAGARAIWQAAAAAAGTPAEAYLRFRGIDPPYPPSLRFLALPCGVLGALPCLVCAVQDAAGEVTGIQRIWLAPDGRGKAQVSCPKKSLGRVKGGAIRLREPGSAGALAVCEGPEDGLSLLAMLEIPVWVAAGASFLPGMEFPAGVRSIVIGADNDAAGQEWADKAAQAFALRGLAVRIIRPLEGFKDFNDELRGVRHG